MQPRCARAPALSPAAAIAPATAVEMHRFSHSRDQVGLFRAALFPLQTSSGQSQRAHMLGGRVTRGARAHKRRKHASEIHAQLRVRAATASVLAPASDARTTHSTPRLASTALRSFARICSIAMFSPATKCPETHRAKASSHTLPWAPARVRLCDGGECPSAAPPSLSWVAAIADRRTDILRPCASRLRICSLTGESSELLQTWLHELQHELLFFLSYRASPLPPSSTF